jgi:hypothetical protein
MICGYLQGGRTTKEDHIVVKPIKLFVLITLLHFVFFSVF